VLIINLREVVGLLIVLPQDVFSKKQRRNSVYKESWKQVETKGCKQRNRCQPRDPDSNTFIIEGVYYLAMAKPNIADLGPPLVSRINGYKHLISRIWLTKATS
jgi:hypothetical protein